MRFCSGDVRRCDSVFRVSLKMLMVLLLWLFFVVSLVAADVAAFVLHIVVLVIWQVSGGDSGFRDDARRCDSVCFSVFLRLICDALLL